ncbi:hypothetical protein A2533_01755 [Candidatus Falkowbacteria bacterium RIFOXYD2_FULL_35_9]|uniref:EF-hand domain-containing protein n=1 Tax=Candidatus Falkowbacteria bacterium RIFOXYC2_FULL_36_12 TaxID=1798002 RepID=A0A1F5T029_9BACT|nr:MAG: hypothetical protein A2300_00920 [Candidatus Falkowbacteria bacterium RIFOXYB2_FULL_35_7]OGF32272.1 MAG: hypothetical protein A2478_03020 [Candidatus Falkowbacteria bacterium RIFOXYC2_FULL_36_12]OGF33851.1 MAG: hypothetical protein A2223_01235 [Candidatus Falkowbacteria bacterium RIFOXYA2_FULL_35_8]OGF47963.1 MAG: hypothetical protein A2533_01755 [Candidatus Falkowbacteria bacterium RIFOXYD2_FULL_35_9]
MKKIIALFIIILAIAVVTTYSVFAGNIIDELRGKIVLQVEDNGEAWYINPSTDTRFFLDRPDSAFRLMKTLGLGITNEHLDKIPIGLFAQSGEDTDKDGLVDLLETAIKTNLNNPDSDADNFLDKEELLNGYNPNGDGRFPILPLDQDLINLVKGKILLQVENHGEAWYVYPSNGKRYFLGRPSDAFEIMRGMGLGISNSDLAKINIAD